MKIDEFVKHNLVANYELKDELVSRFDIKLMIKQLENVYSSGNISKAYK